MENIEEQFLHQAKTKEEKISEKTFVYHGTTSENAEKILTEGIQPGRADTSRFYRGKSLANDFGFSVSRNPIESAKYGEKVIKFELSPTAKIAMPEDLPKIYYKAGSGISFDQIKLIKLAKEAGFDGVDIGAFTELTKAAGGVKAIKEIQIFNPDVLQIVTPEETLITLKEKWKPLLTTPVANTYQHHDTTLILGEKEITFQTSKKIKKIKKDLISHPQDKEDK